MINRRDFIKVAGMPMAASVLALGSSGSANGYTLPEKGPVIKSFSVFHGSGNFNRFIAMNAYDKAPKGIKGMKAIVRIVLADGTVGIGAVGYRPADDSALMKLKQLIGRDPFSFYNWQGDTIANVKDEMKEFFYDARYAWFESAVLDALGKLKKQPVWKLTGESIREGIDPYDGTLYFEDIATNRDASVITETAKKIKADGYRGIKIKLGRPDKWLPGEAGVQRDIDAFIALREAVGSNFNLMADPNNGYANKFDWALKLLKACAPYNMYFIEEIFPDDTTQYKKLQAALLEDNFFIPIADGENVNDLTLFDQYMKDGVYQYLQPDMHTCGYSNIVALARKAQAYSHVKIIPHVWQSQLGLIMSLHASKIQGNINYVEDSRYHEHVVMQDGFIFQDGQWFIPDKPGWGVSLAPDYKQFMTGEEVVIK